MDHPHEDLLDEWALGRITDEVQPANIEQHLLMCGECREAVEAVDVMCPFGKAASGMPGRPKYSINQSR